MPERLEDSIRATAPRPDPAFAERLERRVAAGFPKERARRPGPLAGRLWRPAAALAVSVLLVGVVSAGVLRDRGSEEAGDAGGGPGARVAEPAAGDGGDTLKGLSTPVPAPGASPESFTRSGTPVTPGPRRVVERSASLELRTGADDFAGVTAGVLRVADTTGTIVQRSNVAERDGRGVATYDLRVPSSRLDETLAALSRLADVRARTGSADDITGAFVSASDRVDDARAERRALLRALARADSESERDALRRRLRDTRARIAAAERDVRRVRARADRARVDVTVESTRSAGAWTPGDALDDAGRVLEVAAGVAVVAAAVLLPLLVLAALGAAGARLARRRRREAALG
jgi:Domain of unknown function (DUF4349)